MEEKENLKSQATENSAESSTENTPENSTSTTTNKNESNAEIENLLNEVRQQSSNPVVELDDDEEEMVDISALNTETDTKESEEKKEITTTSSTIQTPISTPNESGVKSTNENIESKDKVAPKSNSDKKSHTFRNIVLGLLVSAFAIGGTFVYMYNCTPEVIPVVASVNIPGGSVEVDINNDPIFMKGIQVQGYDISGKTLDEAKAVLAIRSNSLMPNVDLTVNYEGVDYTYKTEDFDFTYDLNNTIARAYNYNLSLLQAGSTDIMSNVPKDDENITVNSEKGTVNFEVPYSVTQASVQKVIKRVAKKVDIVCREPHVSKFDTSKAKNSQRYTFEEGTEGKVIDQDALITEAMTAFNKGETSVSLVAKSINSKPTLKMADVKQATKLIGKFSTISTNTYNANSNMETALQALNGSIIEPGDILSFNDTTGNSNLESNGYLPAGVISGGQMTTGVGGGICQTATTLYNAAIMANMEIVEREPHLWCSYYVYGGLDATIDWGSIDLKLKNNSKYQMFLRCWMDGAELNVEIYGWQSPDFDEVRTETELDWSNGEYYGYNSYRVFYKNGKKTKTEELPYSTYSLSNGGGIRGADPGDVSTKLKQPE